MGSSRALASTAAAAALALSACSGSGGGSSTPWDAVEHAVLTWTERLEDEDPWVRVSAAQALADLGPRGRPASGRLRELLRDDPAVEVRERSAFALGQLGAAEAVDDLLALLVRDDSRLARAAARALVALGRQRDVLRLALGRFDERPGLAELNEIAHLFAAVGEPAVAPLQARLLSPAGPEVRNAAALCLGQVGEPARAAVQDLERLLAEPESRTRLAAILALAGIGGPEACRALARTVAEDPDAGLRLEALINAAGPCDFQPAEAEERQEEMPRAD